METQNLFTSSIDLKSIHSIEIIYENNIFIYFCSYTSYIGKVFEFTMNFSNFCQRNFIPVFMLILEKLTVEL